MDDHVIFLIKILNCIFGSFVTYKSNISNKIELK